MQTKYKLPKDVYSSVIWIIRGQPRRIQEYKQKLDDILNGGGAKYITFTNSKGEKERAYQPAGKGEHSSAVEIKALALAALDAKPETIKMRAVEDALNEIGRDIESDSVKRILQESIIKNIEDRRQFAYHKLHIPGISRDRFYSYKSEFIYLVAIKTNFC